MNVILSLQLTHAYQRFPEIESHDALIYVHTMKEYANIKARITTDMKRQQKFCKMNSGKVMKYRNKHCCLSALHQSNDQIF